LLLFALWWLTAWAGILEGRVVAIADGDTLTLLDSNHEQHRIRLGGIDAQRKDSRTARERVGSCRIPLTVDFRIRPIVRSALWVQPFRD